MPISYVQNVPRVLKCKLIEADATALSVIVRFQVPPAAMLPFDGAVCVKLPQRFVHGLLKILR